MVKPSTPTREPSSSPFDFPLDVLGQGKLPRRIFKIPTDQAKLLDAPSSWAEGLFRHPHGLANVPAKVLENIIDFHSRQLEAPDQQGSVISSQSPNVPHGETAAIPLSPSGPHSDPAHDDDEDDDAGTPISWPSSPPPVTRVEPLEESDEQPFASQLPEAPAASIQLAASSPGNPQTRRDQSSEQPFESQLPARLPLQAGSGISNVQKRPAFNDFPSSSPALDEELEIVQPAAYDKEMMPPPPHKAAELNATPPSAQQVQVPSTFPEPQSSRDPPQLPKVKAARKHSVQPYIDVEKLLMADLPIVQRVTTSGLRAPPRSRPQTCVPDSSFSDDTSSSIVPSTEHHKSLHTSSKDTNGISPPKSLIRETQVSLGSKQSSRPSQSPKPRPPTAPSLPQIAHSLLSSPPGRPPSTLAQPPASSLQPPKATPLAAAPQVQLPVSSSTVPVPGPSGEDSGPQHDEPAALPMEPDGIRDQEITTLKERLSDLEDQLKQTQLNVAYYAAQARSGSPSSTVHTVGGSKPAAKNANPPVVSDDNAMMVDQVPQQDEVVEKDVDRDPFLQYTSTYPTYMCRGGNIWDFVRACTYILVLRRKRALATYQYDDFIRAWTEGFIPYVQGLDSQSSTKPLTAIEWYMETVDMAHFQFREEIMTKEKIDIVLEIYPEEAKEARKHIRVAEPERNPPLSSRPPAEPVLAMPPTPAIGTAQLLEEVLVQPEEEAASGADPIKSAGPLQTQQSLKGSQSDPIDGTISETRKPKSPAAPHRHSTSGIFSRKRTAEGELVAAAPKRSAGHDLNSRQSERSTPSATLQPSSTSGGVPRSTGPWKGPRKHADDPAKRAKAWEKYLAKANKKKSLRDQDSIVNSSAPPGGTPTSG